MTLLQAALPAWHFGEETVWVGSTPPPAAITGQLAGFKSLSTEAGAKGGGER